MPIPLSTPHAHTQFCDGKSTAAELARAAHGLGFESLGFSGHSGLTFDPVYAMSAEGEAAYIREVGRLRDEYAGRMKIWLGLEADSFSAFDRSRYQYVIASVHYLACLDGYMLPVDALAGPLKEGIDQYYGGDGLAMAEDYFRHLGAYIRSSKPDIIAHFDLVMKNNRDFTLFYPADARYVRAAKNAMDEAVLGCNLMEINTGGMARTGAKVPYPELWMLEYWRGLGGRVILSSDCHHVSHLSTGYGVAEEMAKRAGYREIWMLGTGEEAFVRVGL